MPKALIKLVEVHTDSCGPHRHIVVLVVLLIPLEDHSCTFVPCSVVDKALRSQTIGGYKDICKELW